MAGVTFIQNHPSTARQIEPELMPAKHIMEPPHGTVVENATDGEDSERHISPLQAIALGAIVLLAGAVYLAYVCWPYAKAVWHHLVG